jgi:hypothetical protein
MHISITALLLAASLCGSIRAACPVGPYVVRDQGFLDQFKQTYVDCDQLDGLVVNGASAYSLAPLSDIKTIKGDVVFQESFRFLSLAGMSSLKEIEGSLTVNDMDSVLDFAGFEALERIGGDFKIEDNDQLMDFNGLLMLKEIGGKLEIVANTKLTALFKSTSLLFLGLTPKSDLIVERNPVLVGLDGLGSLKEIKGRISIQLNNALENVDGLKGIFQVDSNVRISRNESLRNVDGLKNLVTCNDTLQINGNPKLAMVDLQALEHVRSRIAFSQNQELSRIEGANSMTKFDGELIIQGNPLLDTIRAFNGLIEAGDRIEFSNNGPVPDFGFLRNLKSVAGTFHIFTSQQVALTGLDSLSRVGRDFNVQTNAQTLAGLERLEYVGNRLHIKGDSLKNITALANLDTVREVSLSNNRHLASLEGIGNIDATALSQVVITFNPKLEHCAVKSMCDLLDLPGKLYLGSNAAGCVDTLALRRSCQEPNGIREPVTLKGGAWRVVPAHGGGIEIRFDLAEASLASARVYDTQGNLVAEQFWPRLLAGSQTTLIPFLYRNRGVYFVEVQLGREKSIAKAIF